MTLDSPITISVIYRAPKSIPSHRHTKMTGPSNAYIGHGPVTLISEDVADIPMNPSACLAQGQPDLPYRWEVEKQDRNISPNSMIPQSVADAFNAQTSMYQQMPILLPQQPFERYSENDNGASIFAIEFESLFDAKGNPEKKLQILHIACGKLCCPKQPAVANHSLRQSHPMPSP